MKNILVIFLLFWFAAAAAQKNAAEVFKNISEQGAGYRLNTAAVPDDALTHAIQKLRAVRGVFNINEAILFKIGEENRPETEKKALEIYFTTGSGRKMLDNAVIWIYRNNFTLAEVKKMTRFYQSSAGRKMADAVPIIMLQSLKAAEEIGREFENAR